MINKIYYSRPLTKTLETARELVNDINEGGCINKSTFICCVLYQKFVDNEKLCHETGIDYLELRDICSGLIDKKTVEKLDKNDCEAIEKDGEVYYISQDLKRLFEKALTYREQHCNDEITLNIVSLQKVIVYLSNNKNATYKRLLKQYHRKMKEFSRKPKKVNSFVKSVKELASNY